MAEKKPVKKPLIKRAVERVKTLFATVDDRYVQWRRGDHVEHCKALLKEIEGLPGGKALLTSAAKNKVKISVVRPRRIKNSAGRFSRAKGKPRIYIANTGDRARMVTTLWHELRHVQQHIDRGDIHTGGVSRLFDTRRQHVISLMIEADAFTAQAMLALTQKKQGNTVYFDAFMSRDTPAVVAIKNFLNENPFETAADKQAFARALFTDIMLDGLGGYNGKYMETYREIFKNRKTVEEFRKTIGKKKVPPEFLVSTALTDMYGQDFAAETSVKALSTAFMRAQTQDVRKTLSLVERAVENADSMNQEEYAKTRREIMTRAKSISQAFNKKAVKQLPATRAALKKAARQDRPPPFSRVI